MKGLDEHITKFDDREPIEDKYKIESYEDYGTFHTVEEAVEYAIRHTHLANEEFPRDWIYKEEE